MRVKTEEDAGLHFGVDALVICWFFTVIKVLRELLCYQRRLNRDSPHQQLPRVSWGERLDIALEQTCLRPLRLLWWISTGPIIIHWWNDYDHWGYQGFPNRTQYYERDFGRHPNSSGNGSKFEKLLNRLWIERRS